MKQNTEDYEILLIRNEISIMLDDLCATIRDSVTAQDIRHFSEHVMSLTPNFTFTAEIARNLKALTEKLRKEYKPLPNSGFQISEYLNDAYDVLNGTKQQIGGKRMGLFQKIFSSKNAQREQEMAEKQAARKELNSKIDRIVAEIKDLEATMDVCVKNCAGQKPDSLSFRENHRKWEAAKQRLQSKRSLYEQLAKSLSAIDANEMLNDHVKEAKDITDATKQAIGDSSTIEENAVRLEVMTQENNALTDQINDVVSSISPLHSTAASVTDSEFLNMVAEQERKNALKEMSAAADPHADAEEADPEFMRQVAEAQASNGNQNQ